MKKFAFLTHFRNDYRTDLAVLAKTLGWLPESFYRQIFRNVPFAPFVWSNITLTPGAAEPQGYVIMLPYSNQHLLQQQDDIMPRIEQGLQLASSLGAEIVGLGGVTSPVTLDGKLLTTNPYTSITNGNAFTAVTIWQQLTHLIHQSPKRRPVVALVGATGSTGSLLAQLLAIHQPHADYLLIDRDERKLQGLTTLMTSLNSNVLPEISRDMERIKTADLVVKITDALLQPECLKPGAVVLVDRSLNPIQPGLFGQRPDVIMLEGGLVATPHIQFSRSLGLRDQTVYASLAETMLLALAGRGGHFSIGHPTLEQAEYIIGLAQRFSHPGFGAALDDSFGYPTPPRLSLFASPGPTPTTWFKPELQRVPGLGNR